MGHPGVIPAAGVLVYPNRPTTATFPSSLVPGGATASIANRSAFGTPGVRAKTNNPAGDHNCIFYDSWAAVAGHRRVVGRMVAHLHSVPKNTSTFAQGGLFIMRNNGVSIATSPLITFGLFNFNVLGAVDIIPTKWLNVTAFSAIATLCDVTFSESGPPKWVSLDADDVGQSIAVNVAYEDNDFDPSTGDIVNPVPLVTLPTAESYTFLGGAPDIVGIYVNGVNAPGAILQYADFYSYKRNP